MVGEQKLGFEPMTMVCVWGIRDIMIPGWTLPTAEQTPHVHRFEHSIIECGGPQLATFVDDEGRRFLSLVSGYDGNVLRWLRASLDDLELMMLCHGVLTLRDVLCKTGVYVVDVTGKDSIPDVFYMLDDPSLIPDHALPEHGAMLPIHTRGPLLKMFAQKKKDQ